MDIETKKFLLETAVKIAQKNIEQKITRTYDVKNVSDIYYGLCAIFIAQDRVDEQERLEKLKNINNN